MDPFLLTTFDGKVRTLHQYNLNGTVSVGYLGARNVLPPNILYTVDFLDFNPPADFFDNNQGYDGLFSPAIWNPDTHWRGWIPIPLNAGQPDSSWVTRLMEPTLAELALDLDDYQLNHNLAVTAKFEGARWSKTLENLKKSLSCPENVPTPASFPYEELDCVLGFAVWFRVLPNWDRGLDNDTVELMNKVIEQVDHIRGFIIDVGNDYSSINLDLWPRFDVPVVAYNLESSPEVVAKFDVNLYAAIVAHESQGGSLKGFEPPAALAQQWENVQKLDLLLRPRVIVSFLKNLRDAQFIKTEASLPFLDRNEILVRLRGLTGADAPGSTLPGRQQVVFYMWRWLENWKIVLDNRQDRKVIGKAIEQMESFQPYPTNRMAREAFRWTNAPPRGQEHRNGAWASYGGTSHLTFPESMFDTSPKYLKWYTERPSTTPLSGSAPPGLSLADRLEVITPPLNSKRKGKDTAENEQSKRPRNARSLINRLSESSSSTTHKNFSHISDEEFMDARSLRDDFTPLTLHEFIPGSQRNLSLDYGATPYGIPARLVLPDTVVHWSPNNDQAELECWIRLPLSARVAFNLIVWGLKCLPVRPNSHTILEELLLSSVAKAYGYLVLTPMQEAYLRYFALQFSEDSSAERLLRRMTAYAIGFRIMEWTPEIHRLSGIDLHFSGKASSARTALCNWSWGGRDMVDDWFMKAGAIPRSPHGARAMIE
ncbi:hypothetical protein BDZ89DRAFT_1150828 [Hymenopellis radicata]|nr:hypothetical protein BDZ89DRAFT_1150828 [Hymenopellis radicata]